MKVKYVNWPAIVSYNKELKNKENLEKTIRELEKHLKNLEKTGPGFQEMRFVAYTLTSFQEKFGVKGSKLSDILNAVNRYGISYDEIDFYESYETEDSAPGLSIEISNSEWVDEVNLNLRRLSESSHNTFVAHCKENIKTQKNRLKKISSGPDISMEFAISVQEQLSPNADVFEQDGNIMVWTSEPNVSVYRFEPLFKTVVLNGEKELAQITSFEIK